MKKFFGVKRQAFVNSGVKSSQMNVLSQRSSYFGDRKGNVFTPFDACLVFTARELWGLMPFSSVDGVITDLVKDHSNLYALLKQMPKQYLIIEEKQTEILGVKSSEYLCYRWPTESMKDHWNWDDHKMVVLVNLEKIYHRVEDLFEKEGFLIAEVDYEE